MTTANDFACIYIVMSHFVYFIYGNNTLSLQIFISVLSLLLGSRDDLAGRPAATGMVADSVWASIHHHWALSRVDATEEASLHIHLTQLWLLCKHIYPVKCGQISFTGVSLKAWRHFTTTLWASSVSNKPNLPRSLGLWKWSAGIHLGTCLLSLLS